MRTHPLLQCHKQPRLASGVALGPSDLMCNTYSSSGVAVFVVTRTHAHSSTTIHYKLVAVVRARFGPCVFMAKAQMPHHILSGACRTAKQACEGFRKKTGLWRVYALLMQGLDKKPGPATDRADVRERASHAARHARAALRLERRRDWVGVPHAVLPACDVQRAALGADATLALCSRWLSTLHVSSC